MKLSWKDIETDPVVGDVAGTIQELKEMLRPFQVWKEASQGYAFFGPAPAVFNTKKNEIPDGGGLQYYMLTDGVYDDSSDTDEIKYLEEFFFTDKDFPLVLVETGRDLRTPNKVSWKNVIDDSVYIIQVIDEDGIVLYWSADARISSKWVFHAQYACQYLTKELALSALDRLVAAGKIFDTDNVKVVEYNPGTKEIVKSAAIDNVLYTKVMASMRACQSDCIPVEAAIKITAERVGVPEDVVRGIIGRTASVLAWKDIETAPSMEDFLFALVRVTSAMTGKYRYGVVTDIKTEENEQYELWSYWSNTSEEAVRGFRRPSTRAGITYVSRKLSEVTIIQRNITKQAWKDIDDQLEKIFDEFLTKYFRYDSEDDKTLEDVFGDYHTTDGTLWDLSTKEIFLQELVHEAENKEYGIGRITEHFTLPESERLALIRQWGEKLWDHFKGQAVVSWKDIEPEELEWFIYIPEEGDWPISYHGQDSFEARRIYLSTNMCIRLPSGSRIWSRPVQASSKLSWKDIQKDTFNPETESLEEAVQRYAQENGFDTRRISSVGVCIDLPDRNYPYVYLARNQREYAVRLFLEPGTPQGMLSQGDGEGIDTFAIYDQAVHLIDTYLKPVLNGTPKLSWKKIDMAPEIHVRGSILFDREQYDDDEILSLVPRLSDTGTHYYSIGYWTYSDDPQATGSEMLHDGITVYVEDATGVIVSSTYPGYTALAKALQKVKELQKEYKAAAKLAWKDIDTTPAPGSEAPPDENNNGTEWIGTYVMDKEGNIGKIIDDDNEGMVRYLLVEFADNETYTLELNNTGPNPVDELGLKFRINLNGVPTWTKIVSTGKLSWKSIDETVPITDFEFLMTYLARDVARSTGNRNPEDIYEIDFEAYAPKVVQEMQKALRKVKARYTKVTAEFDECDSSNLHHAGAYYTIMVTGTLTSAQLDILTDEYGYAWTNNPGDDEDEPRDTIEDKLL